jgi:hypothetical protein
MDIGEGTNTHFAPETPHNPTGFLPDLEFIGEYLNSPPRFSDKWEESGRVSLFNDRDLAFPAGRTYTKYRPCANGPRPLPPYSRDSRTARSCTANLEGIE